MRISKPIRKRHPNITARELATKFGVCIRTVQNTVAESREDFEQRAAERRKLVFDMRFHQRMPYNEIATAMNTTKAAVTRLFFSAKKEHALDFPKGKRITTTQRPQAIAQ
jgi:DNA-directed RNA polymerase specialized sigma24 family protein